MQTKQWGNQKKLSDSYIYFLQRSLIKQIPDAQGMFQYLN